MYNILNGFYVIEGLDGAGTTTQLNLIKKEIKNIWTTFEPTDGKIGCLIRQILRKEVNTTPLSLAFLYSADRAEHLENIKTKLQEGKTVISDRYFFSSLAYQSLDISFDKIKEINDFPFPEKLFYLDTPVEECIRRISKRGEPKELFEKEATLQRVRKNYEKAFTLLPAGCTLFRINGTLSQQKIHQQIMENLI